PEPQTAETRGESSREPASLDVVEPPRNPGAEQRECGSRFSSEMRYVWRLSYRSFWCEARGPRVERREADKDAHNGRRGQGARHVCLPRRCERLRGQQCDLPGARC